MDNLRLTNLKEKASYFSFDMVQVPGRYHKGPDAMSRVSQGGAGGGRISHDYGRNIHEGASSGNFESFLD